MHESIMMESDNHIGFSGHGGVDGIAAKAQTIHGIIGITSPAPDVVARVEILDVDFHFFSFEMGFDFVL